LIGDKWGIWGVLWGNFADLVLDFGEVDKSIGEVDQVFAGARSEANDFDFDTFVGKSIDRRIEVSRTTDQD
jgi:hypothetical protein